MGYYVHITANQNFRIEADQLENVHDALIQLNKHDNLKRGGSAGPGAERKYWFSWMPEDYSYMTTAEEILHEVGFAFEKDPTGALIDFQYDNKQGCEDVFLNACAPYIADGCELDWEGEDSTWWKFVFNNGKMRVIQGRVVFDSEPEPLAVRHYYHDDDGKFTSETLIVEDIIQGMAEKKLRKELA